MKQADDNLGCTNEDQAAGQQKVSVSSGSESQESTSTSDGQVPGQTPFPGGEKPQGVKQHIWEKFQALQHRKIHEKSKFESKNRERHSKDSEKRKRKSEDSVDPGPSAKIGSEWEEVKPYLGINDHLKGVGKGRHAPKTNLEEKIDEAVRLGDMETAEKLSDHLSNRELGSRIAEAFDAKRYAEKKQKEEALAKEKAQKKLKWGFDHKERWETKGNM